MLVTSVEAAAFGTNCYVLATAAGEPCIVVDPGIGVMTALDEVLAEHRLRPAAVLLTHGHLDHVFSVTPVCGARGITAYIHPDDAELLADPAKGLSTDLAQLFGGRLPYAEPEDVSELSERRHHQRGRAGDHGRPRARPYPWFGAVPPARDGWGGGDQPGQRRAVSVR